MAEDKKKVSPENNESVKEEKNEKANSIKPKNLEASNEVKDSNDKVISEKINVKSDKSELNDSKKGSNKTKVLSANLPKDHNNKQLGKTSSNNDSNKTKKNNSYDPNNDKEEQNEFVEKLVSINRVAKVVKGGRRFSFAALVVVGDGNGMVGHGKGKAKEVPEAIKKATDVAKNNMIRVPLRQGRTLHHDIGGRFDSGKVYLRSAPSGTGVIAGGPMRAVFEALGIQDIVAKSVGTSNPHNMVRATFEALRSASSPKIIATRRGLKINDITKRRKVSPGNENVKN